MIPFNLGKLPRIYFGPGKLAELPRLISEIARSVLIITGASSFYGSEKWGCLTDDLTGRGITHFHASVNGEPSPELVDDITGQYRDKKPGVVVAIGGGSVMDTGKAVSAMLPKNESVKNYLEGFQGAVAHDGVKTPFVAIPTTAGTGSEAAKNAVLSQVGPDGFKCSIRHDNFVPDISIVDPELMVSCPPPVTAACGMDAFVQLLESFVSTNANALTDALAASGLEQIRDCLTAAYRDGKDIAARTGMAYAALMSGITLSHAGLGVVHGFASVLGGFFDIPHGVICGTMIGAATRTNIRYLKERDGGLTFLDKYARVGAILASRAYVPEYREEHLDFLVRQMDTWTEAFRLPRLGAFGVGFHDLHRIIQHTENKNNPVKLDKIGIKEILLVSI
ncbi:MAG: iron-containing alcohol dehydrogenase [Desulfosalsimonadaceae bacterium]|nr:iron-containing alcohol dehydrogenase [Desulfosalsimonadaceae bacterium]